MQDFLKKIVSSIVENPEKIEIVYSNNDNLSVYTILVPESEVGKIIGKGGKVINAIRCLAKLKALKEQTRVLVKVESKNFS
ncbi:MAG: KH domain-containing protein [Microgenomates group bacterium]